jgi:hypothetical protein
MIPVSYGIILLHQSNFCKRKIHISYDVFIDKYHKQLYTGSMLDIPQAMAPAFKEVA